MTRADFRCRCGEVTGHVDGATPRTVNRVVCYCDDCQAFLHHLGCKDWLDRQGGTDIVQVAPGSLTFDRGADRIVGVRLSPKGLHRWVAGCCRTPMGNTVGASIPVVGLVVKTFEEAGTPVDAVFGPPRSPVWEKFAVDPRREGVPGASRLANIRVIGRVARLALGWRLKGKGWPNPFFDKATRAPSHPVTTLSRAERDALRPLCGPTPTASPAP